jgi:hypothetical protein
MAAGLGSTVVGADSPDRDKQQFRKHIETANKIGKRKGHAARQKFLNKVGVESTQQRVVAPTSELRSDGDDVSSDKFECIEPEDPCDKDVNGQIDCILTLDKYQCYQTYYSATHSVRFYYKYDPYTKVVLGPESPKDGLGIQWRYEEWRLDDQADASSSVSEDTHIDFDGGSAGGDGVGFYVDDWELCYDAGYTGSAGTADYEWSPREYATAYVTEGKEWESGDAITGGYRHSWSGTVGGIGISYPYGVSFSVSSNVKSEDLGSQLDGDNLRVTAADGTC